MTAGGAEARLRRLWATVPTGFCKGLCVRTCRGPVDTSPLEREILGRHGVEIPHPGDPAAWARACGDPGYVCPALNAGGRCGVYDDRPTGCRVWGASEVTPCPFGCAPEGGRWPAARGLVVLVKAESEVAGGERDAGEVTRMVRWLTSTPEGARAVAVAAASGSAAAARAAR